MLRGLPALSVASTHSLDHDEAFRASSRCSGKPARPKRSMPHSPCGAPEWRGGNCCLTSSAAPSLPTLCLTALPARSFTHLGRPCSTLCGRPATSPTTVVSAACASSRQMTRDQSTLCSAVCTMLSAAPFNNLSTAKNRARKRPVGSYLDPSSWGYGQTTELAATSSYVVDNVLKLPKLRPFARSENAGSKRVLDKGGFGGYPSS